MMEEEEQEEEIMKKKKKMEQQEEEEIYSDLTLHVSDLSISFKLAVLLTSLLELIISQN